MSTTLKKYADRDRDLADACDCRVVTVNRRDFSVYRRNGRNLIPLIAPPARA